MECCTSGCCTTAKKSVKEAPVSLEISERKLFFFLDARRPVMKIQMFKQRFSAVTDGAELPVQVIPEKACRYRTLGKTGAPALFLSVPLVRIVTGRADNAAHRGGSS